MSSLGGKAQLSQILEDILKATLSYLAIGGHAGEDGDEDFDDENINDTDQESRVQLGMIVSCEGISNSLLFKNINWHDWDGGKAGGWPVRACCPVFLEIHFTGSME